MKFGLLTISFKRPRVLQLFLASIKRLRNDCGYFPCVVVGDEEHKQLCEQYKVHHIAMKNHPATDKWNKGVDYLMDIGCDWVVITGSDDICSTPLMKTLMSEMDNDYDLIGISNIYFYAADGKYKGSLRKLETNDQILGVCRCIHRRIIDKVGGVLWNKADSWGMDGIALRNIRPHVKKWKIVDGIVVDVKTSINLNKYTFWTSRTDGLCPPEIFYNIMGEEEKKILNEI